MIFTVYNFKRFFHPDPQSNNIETTDPRTIANSANRGIRPRKTHPSSQRKTDNKLSFPSETRKNAPRSRIREKTRTRKFK